MGLPNLFQPPPGDAGWREYWYWHFQDHLEIMQAIQKIGNIKLTEYSIYPWNENDHDGILERHQQYHTDMDDILGISSNDLSTLNFEKNQEIRAWAYLNYQEHEQAHFTLAI